VQDPLQKRRALAAGNPFSPPIAPTDRLFELPRERTIEQRSGPARELLDPAHCVPVNLDTMRKAKTKVRTPSFSQGIPKASHSKKITQQKLLLTRPNPHFSSSLRDTKIPGEAPEDWPCQGRLNRLGQGGTGSVPSHFFRHSRAEQEEKSDGTEAVPP